MRPDLEPESQPHAFPLDTLRGVFRVFLLYGVAEEIELETVRRRLGIEAIAKTPSFKHPTPDYVALERPPVAEPIEPFVSDSGETAQAKVKYYDYRVASVVLEFEFSGSWRELNRAVNRRTSAPEIATWAESRARVHLRNHEEALRKPYESWISEDYNVIQIYHPEQEGSGFSSSSALTFPMADHPARKRSSLSSPVRARQLDEGLTS